MVVLKNGHRGEDHFEPLFKWHANPDNTLRHKYARVANNHTHNTRHNF